MKHFLLALTMLTPMSLMASINREWGAQSSPAIRSKTFVYEFAQLPLSGSPSFMTRLWSGDSWPTRNGLINQRWNSPDHQGFKLVSPSREVATSMSEEEIAKLAPSEKLDLLNGDYEYTLVKEVAARAYKGAPVWYGICHGWAPAAINHAEPTPKTLISNDGIKIPFGSADIKALLSWYYAWHSEAESTHQMGKRCFFLNPGCSGEDLNAGAFHVALANTLGLRGESMIADIEKSELVWNHPISGYQTTIVNDRLGPASNSAPGTVKRVRVKTEMSYVKESTKNTWLPVYGTVNQITAVEKYEYMLDLDKKGKIIGGEWISRHRPDFLWSMDRAVQFPGMYARLSELLNDQ